MKLSKAMILSVVLSSFAVFAAKAADPASTTPAIPPQVAANPEVPYSYTRMPGPKAGPSNWIPSPYSAVLAIPSNPDASTAGSYYSGKSFGPKPN
jgi:hypothetical protein